MTSASQHERAWPARGGHSVQLYDDEDFLIGAVAQFGRQAITVGDPLIIIAAESHRYEIAAQVFKDSLSLEGALAHGSYVALDAGDTLARFMVGGHPDRTRFIETVGGVIAKVSVQHSGHEVAAFGEMVALLWQGGNSTAALELEELWNELTHQQELRLHCAYPSRLFDAAPSDDPLVRVCLAHSRVVYGADDAALTLDAPEYHALSIDAGKTASIARQLRHHSRSGWAA